MDADTTHTQLLTKPVPRGSNDKPSNGTQRQLAILGGSIFALGTAIAIYKYYDANKNKINKKVSVLTNTKPNNHHPTTSAKKAVPASAATITTTGLTSSSKNGSRYGSRRGSASKSYAHEDTIVGGIDHVAALNPTR